MKEYIEKEVLLKKIRESSGWVGLPFAAKVCALEIATYAPTVIFDKAKGTANWIRGHRIDEDGEEWNWYTCSECGHKIFARFHDESKFCPNCGFRMKDVSYELR